MKKEKFFFKGERFLKIKKHKKFIKSEEDKKGRGILKEKNIQEGKKSQERKMFFLKGKGVKDSVRKQEK